MIEIPKTLFYGKTLEDVVKLLLVYKDQGESASMEFNGVTLYSDNVTMDSAYLKVIGSTKAQFDALQESSRSAFKKQKVDHIASIPELTEYWKDQGREILSQDKFELWDKIVPIRLSDLYQGMELRCCLDIVKILQEEDSFSQAKFKLESQNHSGMSYSLVCAMVKEFSAAGEEFLEYLKEGKNL